MGTIFTTIAGIIFFAVSKPGLFAFSIPESVHEVIAKASSVKRIMFFML
jgi:hypothetical protein